MLGHVEGLKSGVIPIDQAPRDVSGARGSGPVASPRSFGGGSGAIRGLNSAAQVTALNGSMSFEVPIPTSPSRSSIAPQLSLLYNSSSGNGAFGVGWDVPTSQILLKTANTIPRYVGTDTYILSGLDELVPTEGKYPQPAAESGWTVRRFRPRVDDNLLRIEQWKSNKMSSEMYWRTISADNVTTIYGRTKDSRVVSRPSQGSTTPPRIFAWLCDKVFDGFGNCMEYYYKPEDTTGITSPDKKAMVDAAGTRMYLKSIKYGNVGPNRDLQTWQVLDSSLEYLFEVVFDYGEHDLSEPKAQPGTPWQLRQDVFTRFNSGFPLYTQRLCRRILVFHHMLEKLHRPENLVTSMHLNYAESKTCAKLIEFVVEGHTVTDNSHERAVMPAYRFSYQEIPSMKDTEVANADTSNIRNIPGEREGQRVDWIDLDGEGSPGLLTTSTAHQWQYQSNTSALRVDGRGALLSPPRIIDQKPNSGYANDWILQDLDGIGKLDLTSVQRHGFFERQPSNEWGGFRSYVSWPITGTLSQSIYRIDVTGDGLLDIVNVDPGSGQIVWYASRGKEGFGNTQTATAPTSLISAQRRDGSHVVIAADMSGDGLSDLVDVSNGQVTYWPNCGFGVFGTEIVMASSPTFDKDDEFATDRLRFADVDGSGTCDIIYLPQQGGAILYINLAGQQWSEPQIIPGFPNILSLESVNVIDILAKGTACICWCTDSQVAGRPAFQYIDLMKGRKPNLLTSVTNGLGLKTDIFYKPSTTYYLRDSIRGRKWRRPPPFPIYCVEKTKESDAVRMTSTTVTYEYHDGYYDILEREFNGFGQVDSSIQDTMPAIGSRASFKLPETRTKTWYYTDNETYRAFYSTVFDKLHKAVIKTPPDMSSTETQAANRALRGKMIREERYGASRPEIPILVREMGYESLCLQTSTSNSPVFGATIYEEVQSSYEGEKDDPRIKHSRTPLRNAFGDPLLSITTFHGRNMTTGGSVIEQQKLDETQFIEFNYTNPIEEDLDNFRKPMLCASREYHSSVADTEAIVSHRRAVTLKPSGAPSSHPNNATLVAESRIFYRAADMRTIAEIGKLEAFSSVDRNYELVFDKIDLQAIVPDEEAEMKRDLSTKTLPTAGYVELDSDGTWWTPTDRVYYSESKEPAAEIAGARASFFSPILTIDALGNTSFVTWDKYRLFPIIVTDQVKNKVSTDYDYHRMSPCEITDPNDNRRQALYDPLGRLCAFARLGKANEQLGDSLKDFARSSTDILPQLINGKLDGLDKILQDAGQVSLFNFAAFELSLQKQGGMVSSAYVVDISRDKHCRDGRPKLAINISYLDGKGYLYQQCSLTQEANGKLRWLVFISGLQDANNQPVIEFAPWLSDSCAFVAPSVIAAPTTYNMYDPLSRHIGTLNADRTWKSAQFLTWEIRMRSAGSNVTSNLVKDAILAPHARLLPAETYTPSWHEINLKAEANALGAQKSAAYANSLIAHHLDPVGRTIVISSKLNSKEINEQHAYDKAGRLCSITDGLQRLAEVRQYDKIGRCYLTKSMDAGETSHLANAHGQPLLRWVNRRVRFRHEYDPAGRLKKTFEKSEAAEVLTTVNAYGEGLPDDKIKNLRGSLITSYDQAGVRKSVEFDFKGNCTQVLTSLAVDFKSTLDWSKKVELIPDVYGSTFAFDAADRLTSHTDEGGLSTVIIYDNLHRQMHVQLKDGASQPKTYFSDAQYTARGALSSVKYGNGCKILCSYDTNTGDLVERKLTSGESLLHEQIFAYDCENRKIRAEKKGSETSLIAGNVSKPIVEHTFDPFGRLVRSTGRESSKQGGSNSSERTSSLTVKQMPLDAGQIRAFAEEFTYDDAGNIISIRHDVTGASSATSSWTKNLIYQEGSCLGGSKPNNRISRTQIGQDAEPYMYEGAAGDQGCITKSGSIVFTWDNRGLLRSVTRPATTTGASDVTWYVYDSVGTRIRKVSTRSSPGNANVELVAETTFFGDLEIRRTFGTTQQSRTERHVKTVTMDEAKVLLEKTPGSAAAPVSRYQSKTGLEMDESGKFVTYEEYAPFGASSLLIGSTDVQPQHYERFAGYERDSETNLYHCGLRYYAPEIGKWLSTDPLGSLDGLNLYAYCRNDPVNFYDPSGTDRRGLTSPAAEIPVTAARAPSFFDTLSNAWDHLPSLFGANNAERSIGTIQHNSHVSRAWDKDRRERDSTIPREPVTKPKALDPTKLKAEQRTLRKLGSARGEEADIPSSPRGASKNSIGSIRTLEPRIDMKNAFRQQTSHSVQEAPQAAQPTKINTSLRNTPLKYTAPQPRQIQYSTPSIDQQTNLMNQAFKPRTLMSPRPYQHSTPVEVRAPIQPAMPGSAMSHVPRKPTQNNHHVPKKVATPSLTHDPRTIQTKPGSGLTRLPAINPTRSYSPADFVAPRAATHVSQRR